MRTHVTLTLDNGHRINVYVEYENGCITGVFTFGDYIPILHMLSDSQRRTCERAMRRHK